MDGSVQWEARYLRRSKLFLVIDPDGCALRAGASAVWPGEGGLLMPEARSAEETGPKDRPSNLVTK